MTDSRTTFRCPWHLTDEQDGRLCRALKDLVDGNSSLNGGLRIHYRIWGMSLNRAADEHQQARLMGELDDGTGMQNYLDAIGRGLYAFDPAERAALPVHALIERLQAGRREMLDTWAQEVLQRRRQPVRRVRECPASPRRKIGRKP